MADIVNSATTSTNDGTAAARPPFRLLVVDDDPSIREVMSAILAESGYQVLTAEDGMEALDLLPQFQPHLVITDLRMPRLSGFELLEIMRRRFPGLPVIAVSGEFCDDQMPPNVAADAFFAKGATHIAPLAAKITELLSTAGASTTHFGVRAN